jgi:hypothetical protein
MPAEVVAEHLPELLEDGRIELHASDEDQGYLVAPNFMEAQETPQSDKQRSKESRARRRDRARAEQIVTNRDGGDTKRDAGDTKRDPSVTRRHAASRGVTPDQTDPAQTDLALASPDRSSSAAPEGAPEGGNGYDFESLYQLWPRKVAKKEALKACGNKVTTRQSYEALRAAVEEMARLWRGASKEAKQYCPYMSTFVNGERWTDEELPRPKSKGSNGYADPSSDEELAASEEIGFAQG